MNSPVQNFAAETPETKNKKDTVFLIQFINSVFFFLFKSNPGNLDLVKPCSEKRRMATSLLNSCSSGPQSFSTTLFCTFMEFCHDSRQ